MSDAMPVRGYDFHCHVDLYPDPPGMIASCEDQRIFTLAVTTTPKAWPKNQEWSEESGYVYAAVGLHPELVGDRYDELPLLEEYIGRSRLVGEIGLDGSPRHRGSWERQLEVFVRALRVSQDFGKRVVSIHSRRAAPEVVRLLEEHTTRERVLPILHWFSGSAGTARKAADLGAYFSINHRTLEHPRGRDVVRSLPENRLLTETDGPFAARRDDRGQPADVIRTAERLASAKKVTVAEMEKVLARNAEEVLAFAGVDLEGRGGRRPHSPD